MTSGDGVVLGLISSIAYFQLGEKRYAKNNCSYLAPVSTDLLALLASLVLIEEGKKTKSTLTSTIGGAILGIHAQQIYYSKRTIGHGSSRFGKSDQ
jgi:hypothetical protein